MSDNGTPLCADLDGDCEDLDHLHCWLYDPIKGRCPYLSRKPTRPVLVQDETFWREFTSSVAEAYGIPDEAENLYQGSRFIRLKDPHTSPARSPNEDTT